VILASSASLSEASVLLGAVAVVLAAVIAAVVAIWRTKMSLAAESERLQAQLDHDRALREREELRGVVDEAIQVIQGSAYLALELNRFIQMRSRNEEVEEGVFDEAASDLEGLARSLNGFQSRFAVRLQGAAPLTAAVSETRVCVEVLRLALTGAWPVSSREDRDEIRDLLTQLDGRIGEFELEARRLVQSLLGEQGGSER
jgi:hypothetical protein